jgi:hypothetical protein
MKSEAASREPPNGAADLRRRWLPREELTRRLVTAQADAGLRADLTRLAGETTDELGPVG